MWFSCWSCRGTAGWDYVVHSNCNFIFFYFLFLLTQDSFYVFFFHVNNIIWNEWRKLPFCGWVVLVPTPKQVFLIAYLYLDHFVCDRLIEFVWLCISDLCIIVFITRFIFTLSVFSRPWNVPMCLVCRRRWDPLIMCILASFLTFPAKVVFHVSL